MTTTPPGIVLPFEIAVLVQPLADAGLRLEWDVDDPKDPSTYWTLVVRPPNTKKRFTRAQRALIPADVWVTPAGTENAAEAAWIESHPLERVAERDLDYFTLLFQEEARGPAYRALWSALRADKAKRVGAGAELWQYWHDITRPTRENILKMREFALLWWAGNAKEPPFGR